MGWLACRGILHCNACKISFAFAHIGPGNGIGRATFGVWNKVEWIILALFVPLLTFAPFRVYPIAAVAALAIFLLIQSLVLLPILNGRIATIIAGERPAPSLDHIIYIALDLLKLITLGVIVCMQSASLRI